MGLSIAAEFAVTIVGALVVGALIAAPIAPFVAGRLPSRALLGVVGVAVIVLSARVLLS